MQTKLQNGHYPSCSVANGEPAICVKWFRAGLVSTGWLVISFSLYTLCSLLPIMQEKDPAGKG